MHVRGTGDTAGYVAMNPAEVASVLRWLDPTKDPEVVMGPYGYGLTL